MPHSENELIRRLKQRDVPAMRELYDQFGRVVYSVIYHSVRDAAKSEDLSHDAFLGIWNRIRTFDVEKGNLEDWVSAIARNRAVDYLRSIRGKQSLTLIELNALLISVPCPASGFEREARSPVAVQKLNHAQRQVIYLLYFRGFTLVESAGVLQRPLASVKSSVRGALKSLREATDGLSGVRTVLGKCAPFQLARRAMSLGLTANPVQLTDAGSGERQ